MSNPPDKHKIDGFYASLMEEIKVRISCINQCLEGKIILPGAIVRELCFLQIRKICELVALSCLLVHGDIKPTEARSLKKHWAADRLLKALERMHPDFYPHPVRQRPRTPDGPIFFDLVLSGFTTKAQLITLIGKSGSVLHRGNLKDLMSAEGPLNGDLSDVLTEAQGLLNLLSQHWIALADGNTHLFCLLKNNANNGKVALARSQVRPT